MNKYQCLICKEKLRKYHSGRRPIFIPKNLLMWMMDWESEEQVIQHIKKAHPGVYRKVKKEQVKNDILPHPKG